MKNCKARILASALFICVSFSLAAYDYDDEESILEANDTLLAKPTLTPSLTGYFTQAMNWVHTGMLAANGPCVWFIDANLGHAKVTGTEFA